MSRPKLAKSTKEIKDASNEAARLKNPKMQQIIQVETVDPVRVAGSAISGIVKMVLILVMVLVLMFSLITATLMAAVPGEAGLTWLARATFVGGEPESGDFAYISSKQDANSNVLEKLKQGVIALPDASVVEIIAGPAGTVVNDETGRILYNGKPTNFVLPVEERKLLGEYLAICVKGACEPGEQILVEKASIVGEARGNLSLKGVTGYDSKSTPLAVMGTAAPEPIAIG